MEKSLSKLEEQAISDINKMAKDFNKSLFDNEDIYDAEAFNIERFREYFSVPSDTSLRHLIDICINEVTITIHLSDDIYSTVVNQLRFLIKNKVINVHLYNNFIDIKSSSAIILIYIKYNLDKIFNLNERNFIGFVFSDYDYEDITSFNSNMEKFIEIFNKYEDMTMTIFNH